MSRGIEQFLPPHIRALHPYTPGKPIEEVERELGIRALKLASNENPLGPSPRAVEAIREFAGRVNRYPDDQGFYLRKKLARALGLHHDQVILGSGSTDILRMVGMAFLQGESEGLTSEGTFVIYYIVTQMLGATVHRVPMKDYRYDLDAIAAEITPRTRVIFFANPNNPTGTYHRASDVTGFLDRIPSDVLVVLDEAYFEYVDDPEYSRSLEYIAEGRNVLVLRTFSKVHGLAGMRVGYGFGSAEVINCLNLVRSPFNTDALAQAAAIAAMDDEAHIGASVAHNAREKAWLYQRFSAIGIRYILSAANFILVDTGRDANEVFQLLLRRGVIVRPMKENGFPTCLRASIGLHEENEKLVEGLAAVAEPGPARIPA